jgi:hypothetical protein
MPRGYASWAGPGTPPIRDRRVSARGAPTIRVSQAGGNEQDVDQVLRGRRVRKGRGFLAVMLAAGQHTHLRSPRQPAAPQPRPARTSVRAAGPTPAGRTGSLCCERLRQQRSGEISIPLAAGSGEWPPPDTEPAQARSWLPKLSVTRATSEHTTTALWWCRSRPRKAVYPVVWPLCQVMVWPLSSREIWGPTLWPCARQHRRAQPSVTRRANR